MNLARSTFYEKLAGQSLQEAAAIRSTAQVTADDIGFNLKGRLTAHWRGDLVFRKEWSPSLPRRLS